MSLPVDLEHDPCPSTGTKYLASRPGGQACLAIEALCCKFGAGYPVFLIFDSRGIFVTNPPIISPCIKVCAIDGTSGQCLGCGRTLNEIANWARLDDAGRQRVMDELPERLAHLAPQRGEGTAS